MKYLKKYNIFNESNSTSDRNIVRDICVSMTLLNENFLSDLLDKGVRNRYNQNSQVFLTDLRNLILAKNRLKLGKFQENKFVEDLEISKVNQLFNIMNFDLEQSWNVLTESRNIARAIVDKLIIDDKITSDKIKSIYWNAFKTKDADEDIILELVDGKQYSFYLNKNLNRSKTASFNKLGDELIGDSMDVLYKDEYLSKWNKLIQSWIRLIYENANKDIQNHIEKFINPKLIDNIGYFEFFEIKHQDQRFKHLGEYIKEVDKNILKLSELLNLVWKLEDEAFMDWERVSGEWKEIKKVILNSRILENLLTKSIKSNFGEHITKLENGFKKANGTLKMRLFKILVDKMGSIERNLYYISNSGNNFEIIPNRDFFRENYDKLDIMFDYHVKFENKSLENFPIKIKVNFNEKEFINLIIEINFSGGEISTKLSAKYNFELANSFNFIILDSLSNDIV
jgi:hypothetical protein